ncbi:MAG: sulfotransferase domain-containing protein [Pseudomonadota bacterium]
MPGSAIWLASYPKSGNTWMRLALRSLVGEGEEVALTDIARFGTVVISRDMFDKVLETESGHLTDAEIALLRPTLHDALFAAGKAPSLVKVHDMWLRTAAGRPLFDRHHTHATIYILRDPRDVAISWARFMNRSIDWAIAYLANPGAVIRNAPRQFSSIVPQAVGHWSTHVTSWIDDSDLGPVVVRYEDMHADLPAILRRIAERIGWSAGDVATAGAVAATQFDRLAEQERRHGFGENPDTAERFFRAGRAGGWRDILTPDQVATIERDHGAVMRRFGYL